MSDRPPPVTSLHAEIARLKARVAELEEQLPVSERPPHASAMHTDPTQLAHAIRNPLHVILGTVQAFDAGVYGTLRPEQTAALERIRQAGNQLLADITHPPSTVPPVMVPPPTTLCPREPAKQHRPLPSDATILVVDDSELNLLTVTTYLEDYGYTMLTAHGGNEALALIDDTPPSLAILDLHMPDIDGIELAAQLRTHLPHLPIILMTAHDEATVRTLWQTAGVNACLRKPVELRELDDLLREYLATG